MIISVFVRLSIRRRTPSVRARNTMSHSIRTRVRARARLCVCVNNTSIVCVRVRVRGRPLRTPPGVILNGSYRWLPRRKTFFPYPLEFATHYTIACKHVCIHISVRYTATFIRDKMMRYSIAEH